MQAGSSNAYSAAAVAAAAAAAAVAAAAAASAPLAVRQCCVCFSDIFRNLSIRVVVGALSYLSHGSTVIEDVHRDAADKQ